MKAKAQTKAEPPKAAPVLKAGYDWYTVILDGRRRPVYGTPGTDGLIYYDVNDPMNDHLKATAVRPQVLPPPPAQVQTPPAQATIAPTYFLRPYGNFYGVRSCGPGGCR